ncbi:CC/Se motif family (seleno)protein [Sporomusa aerivorans]|uniref:CC/Se motif family (seleno)protein n=1 Tax=Sporomusa aerivorans TaxID=204936 RepID=UPI00352AF5C4
MNMTVTERAQEFIAKEGGVITVRIEKRLIPGCGKTQTADVAAVRVGEPQDYEKADYQSFKIDGVTVHAHSSVAEYNDQILLRIDTETNLFGQKLGMFGLPMPRQSCGDCTSC